jgi:hypothetical protein
LAKFCTLEVELGPVLDLGLGRAGQRRTIPIVGGRVSGRIEGRILPGGADWQTIGHDGVASLDARYTFETPDGALVEIVNQGFRHGPEEVMKRLAAGEPVAPEAYYMRSVARLESGHPTYQWVNRLMFVGTGARNRSSVQIELYDVQ